MKTKQIVFTEKYKAEFLDAEYSHPEKDEVTVSLSYSAISAGTEKANLIGSRNGMDVAEDAEPIFPRCLGYSSAGVVTEVGSDVDDIKVGDRVLVYWGFHKKNITINRKNVVKLPDEVDFKQGAVAFISTFPLAAIRKTKLEMAEPAMVVGLGILGMFAVKELKAAGAVPVVAVDPVKERREFALKMGADHAFDPTEEGFCDKVKEITGGGVKVAIEVTGLGEGLINTLDCMRDFGRVALLGCTRNSKFNIDYYSKVHGPGITIVGAHTIARPERDSYPGYWTAVDDIKAVLEMLKYKRLDYSDMICEIHDPSEAPEVYTRLVNDKNFPIGVLFDWTNIG